MVAPSSHFSYDAIAKPAPVITANTKHTVLPISDYPSSPTRMAQEGDLRTEALTCAVCLSDVDTDDIIRMVQACKHIFHARCLEKWLTRY